MVHNFRHGKVVETLEGCCRGGETDCDLSEFGKAQTLANIQYLVTNYFDDLQDMEVITSGMGRSDFFGKELAKHGVHHRVDPRFRTIAAGEWEGMSWKKIEEEWPEQFQNAHHAAENLAMPGGEPFGVFRDRVREALLDCLKMDARHIVIVGHGCTNEIILATAEGRETGLNFRSQPIACMNKIHVSASDVFEVIEKQSEIYKKYLSVV